MVKELDYSSARNFLRKKSLEEVTKQEEKPKHIVQQLASKRHRSGKVYKDIDELLKESEEDPKEE